MEVLRDCLPSSVRRTLNELPESLDETYERILKEIKKPNRDLARRVLQCLVVAARPLRVTELAEVLAVNFDDAEGIPRLNSDWRWEDQEQALLIACSSLIAIVEPSDVEASDSDSDVETDDGDSRVVQFSHFSVKEFLTSPRLATASGEVSSYHIDSEPANMTLAQACLGVLLQIQDSVEGPKDHTLARYAAEHWTTHAQFWKVSSRLRKGMEYLFDANKPHFKVWLTLCDIDIYPNPDGDATFYQFARFNKSPAAPLYYTALCGFHDLAEQLITKHPQDVNADGGRYVRPLVAALAGEHFQTADLLRHHGAHLDVRGQAGTTPLHGAAWSGNLEVVRILIEYDSTSINATSREEDRWTPLHFASGSRYSKTGSVQVSVVRLLLERGADINARDATGWTPLHQASYSGAVEVVRLLLENGADVEAKVYDGRTVLQIADDRGHDEIVKLLREYGAK